MEYTIKFESYLREQGKAEKTIKSYTSDVSGFLAYLHEKELTFNGVLNRFTVSSYKTHLLRKDYEPTTINKKLNSLQSLNLFLIDLETMTEKVVDLGRDRIKIAKGSEKPVEVLGDEALESLLLHLESKVKSIRDKVIIYLLLYTGVRVSELCGIRIKDVDFLTYQLKILGKGGKYREIPLKAEVMEIIKVYLVMRKESPYYESDYLILGQRGAIGSIMCTLVKTQNSNFLVMNSFLDFMQLVVKYYNA